MAHGGEEGGAVIACQTKRDFYANMSKGMETGKLVAIEFTASWSDSCRSMAPVLAKFAKMYPASIFLTVDVDELTRQVDAAYAADELPAFIFIRNGDQVHTVWGAREDHIYAWVADDHAT